jgi:hypothetical protein
MSGLRNFSQNEFSYDMAERDYLYPRSRDPEIFSLCEECAKEIYYGDFYFAIGSEKYCDDCAKDLFMRVAD